MMKPSSVLSRQQRPSDHRPQECGHRSGLALPLFLGSQGVGPLPSAPCHLCRGQRSRRGGGLSPLDQFEQLDPSMPDALRACPWSVLTAWRRSPATPCGSGPCSTSTIDGRRRGTLIVTGCSAPRKLGLQLPDLASRLDWGVSFHLDELDDEGKLSALQLRAELRGFKLPIDVGRFLLNRPPATCVPCLPPSIVSTTPPSVPSASSLSLSSKRSSSLKTYHIRLSYSPF